jgi:glycosyltransferase involved in cell wall biosynthesis
VPSEDVKAFAAAIDALAGEPARLQTLGRAARQRVEVKFNLDEEANRYQEFYDDLLGCGTTREGRLGGLDRAAARA